MTSKVPLSLLSRDTWELCSNVAAQHLICLQHMLISPRAYITAKIHAVPMPGHPILLVERVVSEEHTRLTIDSYRYGWTLARRQHGIDPPPQTWHDLLVAAIMLNSTPMRTIIVRWRSSL
jgi:hypothetical protein